VAVEPGTPVENRPAGALGRRELLGQTEPPAGGLTHSGCCGRDRAGQPGGAACESVCPLVLSDGVEEVAVMVEVA
jgi:hypothetical protein